MLLFPSVVISDSGGNYDYVSSTVSVQTRTSPTSSSLMNLCINRKWYITKNCIIIILRCNNYKTMRQRY